MTSRVEQAAGAGGPRESPVLVTYGYVSFRHTVTAIGRSALAYSNSRRLWRRLAYLDLPLLWLFLSLSIARRPNQLVTLGVAGGQLARDDGVAGERPPRTASLLWLLIVADAAALFAGPVIISTISDMRPALIVSALLLLVLVISPMLTYAAPALIQQFGGRGVGSWRDATLLETGRRPVFVSQLAAWPNTGGGRKGTGEGFTLMNALADDARSKNQIMIGVARSKTLATKYVDNTRAEQSSHNPRHLRWP